RLLGVSPAVVANVPSAAAVMAALPILRNSRRLHSQRMVLTLGVCFADRLQEINVKRQRVDVSFRRAPATPREPRASLRRAKDNRMIAVTPSPLASTLFPSVPTPPRLSCKRRARQAQSWLNLPL